MFHVILTTCRENIPEDRKGDIKNMLSIDEVRSLLDRGKGDKKILSVYLNTAASSGTWKSKLYSLQRNLDSIEETLEPQERSHFSAERTKLEKFLSTLKPHGKCLAVFSNSPNLWWTKELGSSVAESITFSLTPKIIPLVELLDEYQRFCAVMIDNQSARIFLIKVSEIEAVKHIKDFVPGKHKQTEFNPRVEGKHRSMVQSHLRKVVDEIKSLNEKKPFNRLFLGGTPDARVAFEKSLPSELKQSLHGQFSASMNQTDDAIKKSAVSAAEKYEHFKEAQTIESLETRALKNGAAVLGCDSTLLALQNSRAFELVVAGDTRIRGCKCSNCGLASQTIVRKCSLCQGNTVRIEDLAEEAVQTAIKNGTGRIEVIKGSQRDAFAETHVMGAFLLL